MGVVDLAVAPDGREVALKRLALHGSSREMIHARQRIRREAEALETLHHPGIVELIEVIDDGDDIVLVMPYLPGGTLTDHVQQSGPLSPAQLGHLADTLAAALAQAHRHGIIHRDIKPGNVLFDGHGNAYLTDFGIATLRDATSGLTLTGAIVGTPDFMAPEQARGEPATAASDVFSLGATLLYAATGHPPYGSADARVTIQRAAKGRLAPFPDTLDKDLRKRLTPLLRRDPERRPSAAEVVGGPAGTVVAAPTSDPGRLRRVRNHLRDPARARSGRRWAVAFGAVAIASVALIAVAAISTGDDRPPGDASEPGTTATTPCAPLPYQPCGQPEPAPNTDGTTCLAGYDDYDADPANGCEAVSDDIDGRELVSTITANLVPRTDIDRYPTTIRDDFQLLCDGTFKLTLTAPAGTAMRVELLEGERIIDATTSRDGEPATLSVGEPNCFGDDGGDYVVRVSWVGEARSAEPYTLTRSGNF